MASLIAAGFAFAIAGAAVQELKTHVIDKNKHQPDYLAKNKRHNMAIE